MNLLSHSVMFPTITTRKVSKYGVFFWSVFSRIWLNFLWHSAVFYRYVDQCVIVHGVSGIKTGKIWTWDISPSWCRFFILSYCMSFFLSSSSSSLFYCFILSFFETKCLWHFIWQKIVDLHTIWGAKLYEQTNFIPLINQFII